MRRSSATQFSSTDLNKIFLIFCLTFIFLSIVVLKLFYLQFYCSEELLALGERNFFRIELLDSLRGNVVDCHSNLLATNRPVFDLYWSGAGARGFSQNQKEMILKIAKILNISDFATFEKSLNLAERQSKRSLIRSDISFELLCQISEQCGYSNSLLLVQNFIRTYPHKNLASHILGYLRPSIEENFVGRYGIEKIFHEQLKGERGYVVHVTTARGKKILKKDEKQARLGSEIKLTLDLRLQQIAESVFDTTQTGAFILIDPETGAIKVMFSYPNFDPNKFLGAISQYEWENDFSENNPFLNRATMALYPPASIFKLITFTAGLEEGIINQSTQFECRGFCKFCDRKYFCIRRFGHGIILPYEGIAYSCNIPCFEIAKKIKIDQLASYAFKFGLGTKTDFLLSENAGLVPTTSWKRAIKGEPWWKGDTLSSCIGQSYFLVTPLQIARTISSIYTGTLVKPRILEDEPIVCEPLQISKDTLDFLKSSMKYAVNMGTAISLKKLESKGFSISAKTGTAQTISLDKLQTDRKMLEHGWFTSFFSYKNKKPLVMVVLLEHTGRSGPSIEMALKFLREYAQLEDEADKAYTSIK